MKRGSFYIPVARVKRIMQSNKDIGKIANAAPYLQSHCLELFINDLLKNSVALASESNCSTLQPYHLKKCIEGNNRFDFLKDLVADVPDIAPIVKSSSKSTTALKRKRMKESEIQTTKKGKYLKGETLEKEKLPSQFQESNVRMAPKAPFVQFDLNDYLNGLPPELRLAIKTKYREEARAELAAEIRKELEIKVRAEIGGLASTVKKDVQKCRPRVKTIVESSEGHEENATKFQVSNTISFSEDENYDF